MLLKNNEPFKLTTADIKEIQKEFKVKNNNVSFNVRLIYPENRVKKSLSPNNRLPDKPNSISFPLVGQVYTDKGADIYRYCENATETNTGMKFTPNNLIFNGVMVLEAPKDIELIWWLLNVCQFTENGKNYQGKNPKCKFENLVKMAEDKVKIRREKAKLDALLFNEEIGLTESKLRMVAKAMGVDNSDDYDLNQLQLEVEKVIYSRPDGRDKFFGLIDAEQVLIIRSTIQKAKDDGIIQYQITKRNWAWVTEPGKKNEEIIKVPLNKDYNDAIYEYYISNGDFAKELAAAIKGEFVQEAE